jgi:hypothetical protein
MPLTPVNNGDSGSGARGKINTAFVQIDTNTADILTKQPLDADLTAIVALSSNGLITKTGTGTVSARTITGTANKITVTNGDGVSANPILTIGTDVVTLTGTQILSGKILTAPLITSPTGLVKADVGLGNVDDTSDASKPVSAATSAALFLKQDVFSRSTLNKLVRTLGSGSDYVLSTLEYQTFFRLVTSAPINFVITGGLPNIAFGSEVEVYNDSTSSDIIQLLGFGGVAIYFANGTNPNIAVGESARVLRLDVLEWVRLS